MLKLGAVNLFEGLINELMQIKKCNKLQKLTRGNVVRGPRLKKFSMVILLCYYHSKLGRPLFIKKLACLLT